MNGLDGHVISDYMCKPETTSAVIEKYKITISALISDFNYMIGSQIISKEFGDIPDNKSVAAYLSLVHSIAFSAIVNQLVHITGQDDAKNLEIFKGIAGSVLSISENGNNKNFSEHHVRSEDLAMEEKKQTKVMEH